MSAVNRFTNCFGVNLLSMNRAKRKQYFPHTKLVGPCSCMVLLSQTVQFVL